MRTLITVLGLIAASSCASLRSVSLTQVPENREHAVESSASSWGILSLYFSNGFVDEAIDGLREKCPGGKISGVYTKYESRYYLLWGTRTVTAKGYCEGSQKS